MTVTDDRNALVDQLATLEHERWAHWQRYLHDMCRRLDDGSLVIPADLVDRWERQIDTPFAALPEPQKDSDREQVLRYFSLIDPQTHYERGKADGAREQQAADAAVLRQLADDTPDDNVWHAFLRAADDMEKSEQCE